MIYSIPFSAPFLETIADYLLSRQSAFSLSEWTIYLPTYRAGQALSDILFKKAGRQALVLPKILSLGDLAPEEIALSSLENAELPFSQPIISSYRRKLLLASLISKFQYTDHPISFDQALIWAESLLSFIDEMRTEGIDLKTLQDVSFTRGGHAEHLEKIQKFLTLLGENWDEILEEEGCIESIVWQRQVMKAQAHFLEKTQRDAPVMIAGSMGTIESTAHLIKVIAHLKNGVVILSGFPSDLPSEPLPPHHPQFLLKKLLDKIEVPPREVQKLDLPKKSSVFLEHIFDDLFHSEESVVCLENVQYVDASDEGEEARLVAISIRKALEEGKRKIICISPDQKLLRRISTELRFWSLSAVREKKPLMETEMGSFLHLLSLWFSEPFPAVSLASTFKHVFGPKKKDTWTLFEKQVLRRWVGTLSLEALDYFWERPLGEIDAQRAEEVHLFYQELKGFLGSPLHHHSLGFYLDKMEQIFQWVLESDKKIEEIFRETDPETAGDFHQLWSDLRKSASFIVENPKQVADIFFNLLSGHQTRHVSGEHNDIILLMCPAEARFIEADFIILAGLNEGIWPADVRVDPFFSASMRHHIGLPSLENKIGQSAHDFLSFLCREGPVLLTRSLKAGGNPSVPSRFLSHLTLFLNKHRVHLSSGEDLKGWMKSLREVPRIKNLLPPAPIPPVADRPKKLSITDIGTLLKDPYSIYAKHILKLVPLDGFASKNKARLFGIFTHHFLHRWHSHGEDFGGDVWIEKAKFLFQCYMGPIDEARLWWEKFLRSFEWVKEKKQLKNSLSEVKGEMIFAQDLSLFTLFGRADRIDWEKGNAILIDYKTGTMPSLSDIKRGKAPQLALEALILLNNGFRGVPSSLALKELQYWGLLSQEIISITEEDLPALVEQTQENLKNLIESFQKEDMPYLSHPKGGAKSGSYDHLSRVQEWGVIE